MQNSNIIEKLKSTPLFAEVEDKALSHAVSQSKLCEYEKGALITSEKPALFAVLRGSVCVYRREGGQNVLLNTIKDTGVFGAAQLFCGEAAFSSVKASSSCSCLQIPKDAVCELLKNDFAFTENYVAFLSDRIRFLNKKIASFTAGNGEKTLAGYLLSLCPEDGVVQLNQNMSRLASSLNLSRPTLYRAFISLSDRGIIEKNGKEIKIKSVEKLKNI